MTATDLVIPEQASGGLAIPSPSEAISRVVAQYATDLQHCAGFAEAIIDTPFVPAGLWPLVVLQRGDQVVTLKATGRDGWDPRRRHPQESDDAFAWRRRNAVATTGAIVYSGAILGLNWQAALSGIYVANGRTSLYAEQMRALIQAAGHRFEIVTRSADVCTVAVARRGDKDLTEFTFTMREAVVAGYVKGKGPNTGQDSWKGNDRYNTNPSDMLFARATSIAAKSKFADVIRGMETRETLDDDRPAPVDITAQVEVTQPAERTTKAAILAAASGVQAPENMPNNIPADVTPASASASEPEVTRAVLPITEARWGAINATFRDLGINGTGQKADRLKVVAHIIGRQVARGSELTADEGRLVHNTLMAEEADQLVSDVLGWQQQPTSETVPQEDAADASGEASWGPMTEGTDDYDPTTNAGFGMDGAEAAGEEALG